MGYQNKIDQIAWLFGSYVYEGVSVALAQSFSKSTKAEYPVRPHTFKEPKVKTLADKKKVGEQLFAQLEIMQFNFNQSRG